MSFTKNRLHIINDVNEWKVIVRTERYKKFVQQMSSLYRICRDPFEIHLNYPAPTNYIVHINKNPRLAFSAKNIAPLCVDCYYNILQLRALKMHDEAARILKDHA